MHMQPSAKYFVPQNQILRREDMEQVGGEKLGGEKLESNI